MKHINLIFNRSFIGGEWIDTGEKTFDVLNPFDDSVIQSIKDCNDDTIDLAARSAKVAQKKWKRLSAKERADFLYRWYLLIKENKEELAKIMTLESGKPIVESRGEVEYGAAYVQWFGEEAKRVYGATIPGFSADRRVLVVKEPVGVVATITPWNFPLAMITRKVAPALAVGCTAIIRPSSATPLTALAVAALAQEAGIPDGVINVVVGSNSTTMGKQICENKLISKLSFTGSTRVGEILTGQCASTFKKTSFELGGNAPFIVFDDADIDLAVKGAMLAKFRFAGQTCVCTNRFLIHEKVYDEFADKFVKAVRSLKMGNGLDEKTDIGPLINKKAITHAQALLDDALEKGGKVLVGGKVLNENFFEPTVVADAKENMSFSQEEIFAPIAPLYRFSTDEEAIELANNTVFGLASYFYTNNIKRAWLISEALEYGIVGINEGAISSETVPFGGIKHSGSGREGSKYGLDSYTEIKYLCFGDIK